MEKTGLWNQVLSTPRDKTAYKVRSLGGVGVESHGILIT